jgi:glutamyl-tRNA synthetase
LPLVSNSHSPTASFRCRFDDTNPSKEKEEFQQSIVEDLKKLGVFPDVVTYTSDYFAQLKSYALWLIDEGLAFMDDTPQEEMQVRNGKTLKVPHHSNSIIITEIYLHVAIVVVF